MWDFWTLDSMGYPGLAGTKGNHHEPLSLPLKFLNRYLLGTIDDGGLIAINVALEDVPRTRPSPRRRP